MMTFADLSLAQRVEETWAWLGLRNAEAHARLDPKLGAAALGVAGGYAVFLGEGSPLSQAQGLGLYGRVNNADIERMEIFFRDRQTPVRVEVASLADPTLLTRLQRRGYEIVEQTHMLVCSLEPDAVATKTSSSSEAVRSQHGPALENAPGVSEVTVEPVGPGRVPLWADSVLRCFFDGPVGPPAILVDGAIAMASIQGVSCWLARIDEKIAGGGALVIRDRLALICGDGTASAFRSNGVQSVLLTARLLHATRAGCDLAAICTQPGSGSQRNAERHGFHVVYARTLMVLE